MNPIHTWKFLRVGGVDQVMFRNGSDLTSIDRLDQKLWMALAIPRRGVEFDARTAFLMTDAGKHAGCWYFGKLDQVLPNGLRSMEALGTGAPAYKSPGNVPLPATP